MKNIDEFKNLFNDYTEDKLLFILDGLGDVINEKKIVLNNQKELLKVDNSILREHIKLFEEVNYLMQKHHFFFIQLAEMTQDEQLLEGVRKSEEILNQRD